MTRVVVTGACGFVGSNTVDTLLASGEAVLGIDSVNSFYDPAIKRENLATLLEHPRFEFIETDLAAADLGSILQSDDTVVHIAGLAGVRTSWAGNFGSYLSNNVAATQNLLESAVACGVRRIVNASSSSVYGNNQIFPVAESALPGPHSPYGVTKLAAEHLCNLYAENFGLSTVSLRYFTVYGPRQRPDMAIHRLIECGISGDVFKVFGDGSQRRDFTYVGDVVAANMAACTADVAPGTVLNIAGGTDITLADLIERAAEAIGRPIPLEYVAASSGDVARTGGIVEKAMKELDWAPSVSIDEGLKAQALWHQSRSRSKETQAG